MVVRDEELPELDTLQREACPYPAKGGSENKHGKANVLLQVRERGCRSRRWDAPLAPAPRVPCQPSPEEELLHSALEPVSSCEVGSAE